MNWRAELQRSAEKELAGLSDDYQKRIARVLLAFMTQPFPPGFKKLKGSDGYRIGVGDYRILYRVAANAQSVVDSAIGHRREVYR